MTSNIYVPITLKRHCARKLVLSDSVSAPPKTDNILVQLIVRAYTWQRQYDDGGFSSLDGFAKHLQRDRSYVARVLRVMLLAPDILENILDGKHPRTLTIAVLTQTMPLCWMQQRAILGM